MMTPQVYLGVAYPACLIWVGDFLVEPESGEEVPLLIVPMDSQSGLKH